MSLGLYYSAVDIWARGWWARASESKREARHSTGLHETIDEQLRELSFKMSTIFVLGGRAHKVLRHLQKIYLEARPQYFAAL